MGVILENISAQRIYKDENLFVAFCYLKRIQPAMTPIVTETVSMMSIQVEFSSILNTFNETVHRNLTRAELMTAKNNVLWSQNSLDKSVKAYSNLYQQKQLGALGSLINRVLRSILGGDEISTMVVAHVDNLIREIETPPGMTKADFLKSFVQ
ncbi:hypothetical protein RF11_01744 [Thelohanellus kitauei]|uniref:Uncharacterized protein n=1 Tax=Thelohanellus kitauei TaxID=669202 RepID=A0A0C2IVZ6_THEKT|nr:hypothetical protein RF11_01744 [Thelohanellus kitauei]